MQTVYARHKYNQGREWKLVEVVGERVNLHVDIWARHFRGQNGSELVMGASRMLMFANSISVLLILRARCLRWWMTRSFCGGAGLNRDSCLSGP